MSSSPSSALFLVVLSGERGRSQFLFTVFCILPPPPAHTSLLEAVRASPVSPDVPLSPGPPQPCTSEEQAAGETHKAKATAQMSKTDPFPPLLSWRTRGLRAQQPALGVPWESSSLYEAGLRLLLGQTLGPRSSVLEKWTLELETSQATLASSSANRRH